MGAVLVNETHVILKVSEYNQLIKNLKYFQALAKTLSQKYTMMVLMAGIFFALFILFMVLFFIFFGNRDVRNFAICMLKRVPLIFLVKDDGSVSFHRAHEKGRFWFYRSSASPVGYVPVLKDSEAVLMISYRTPTMIVHEASIVPLRRELLLFTADADSLLHTLKKKGELNIKLPARILRCFHAFIEWTGAFLQRGLVSSMLEEYHILRVRGELKPEKAKPAKYLFWIMLIAFLMIIVAFVARLFLGR